MEAKPSPLVVGREFVRQYYTLLHNSPDHLHRFYNQHSSFTHKGWDPDASKDDEDVPIVGQKNIHDKIQAMNFRDCHAKISHVDAQATLGDGVVVQVFGELSNDGHQMRRFTQTFVLACQSPKKYYVHNDIFRYHDIYCEDDDQQREEHEVDTANVGNNTSEGSANAPMMVQQNVFYAQPPPGNVIAVNANPTLVPTFAAGAPVVPNANAPPQVNGIMHEEMLKNIATQTSQTQLITQAPPQVLPMAPAPTALPIPVEPVAVVPEVMPIVNVPATTTITSDYEADQLNGNDSDTLDNSKETDTTSSDEAVKTVPSPAPANNNNSTLAPKNWANLVKTGPGLNFTGAPPQPEIAPVPQPQSFIAITQQQQQQAQQQKQAETYSTVDRRQVRQPSASTTAGGDRERRISSNANSDGTSQLFLGNLPTNATEEELRTLFSCFGKITDLRIHPKQTQKGGTGRPGPNYGFITFEKSESAARLQEAQPIYYPILNDKRGTKLNVEAKIRKNETSGNSGRSGNDQNQDRGRNNNPGGGGMNRNGSGGRSDRRDDRNRQFNRSERGMGGSGGGPRQNGNSGTFTNSRR